ncbi:hypothetical protein M407DRAFT_244929 [Tulasnella calospora MUT 4182]|uniref:Uncharacterized protein n=1 Tax=Tulasnella calospora MUT 4182 TaxID=1051891 RepID=A0A0C3Q375_9AGAM|nr:hypothetical protein M407DRAFT_244929 [Tulasnella calospora MUT 4182]
MPPNKHIRTRIHRQVTHIGWMGDQADVKKGTDPIICWKPNNSTVGSNAREGTARSITDCPPV